MIERKQPLQHKNRLPRGRGGERRGHEPRAGVGGGGQSGATYASTQEHQTSKEHKAKLPAGMRTHVGEEGVRPSVVSAGGAEVRAETHSPTQSTQAGKPGGKRTPWLWVAGHGPTARMPHAWPAMAARTCHEGQQDRALMRGTNRAAHQAGERPKTPLTNSQEGGSLRSARGKLCGVRSRVCPQCPVRIRR